MTLNISRRRRRRAKSAIVLLAIGLGGMLISAFIDIPTGIRYLLAGATIGVEGMDMLEDA
jgi:hypothetical protein